jgi:C-terminal processing protease CtpA/Prc
LQRLSLTFAALAILTGRVGFCHQAPGETDRLVAVGKLWITVKYFHPYLAYRDIDWDKALADALPKIRAARGHADYASAIQWMLDPLHDPSTYVLPEPANQSTGSIKTENTPDGILIVSPSIDQHSGADSAQQLKTALKSAHKIIFDLRGNDFLSLILDRPDIQASLTSSPLSAPAQRTWTHDAYRSAFHSIAGTQILGDATAAKRTCAFILGENSRLPTIGSALFATGSATVLSESPHYRFADVETVSIPVGEGVEAIVRLSESPLWQQIRTVSHDQAIQEAHRLVANGSLTLERTILPLYPSPQPDKAYAENRCPSAEYRILAAYKIWGAFHYFFAYRDLMDEDWDEVFPAFIPKFIAAKDAREYNLTIAEMVAHVADSGTTVESEELSEYFGKAPAGLRLRLIEKKPVITEILDDEAKKAGIQIGDIVAKVDGQSIVDRFNSQSPYVASSTPQWHGYRVIQRILNGPENSVAALTVGGQDGRTREINLKRSMTYSEALRNQRTGEVIQLLPGNIGYADLDRLIADQVDGMFDKLLSARAIIFDMRGYPRGTVGSLAPRLTDEHNVPAAIFTGALSLAPDLSNGEKLTSNASYFFVQKLPACDKRKYKNKTVMLVDERTIGAGEHTGLFLEAANKTEFIGSASAGADSDSVSLVVPGAVTINFSGHDVRHANGGKLQRLGLQPAVSVAPTINGIRHGRDEVLDKAIEYLSQ